MVIDAEPTPGARGGPPPDRSDRSADRVARGVRAARATLVLVVLAVSMSAFWSSQMASNAAQRAAAAYGLSADYAGAAGALGTEESLEREYRIEPAPEIRTRFDGAGGVLVDALTRISHDGDTADRALARQMLDAHHEYVTQTHLLFRAVDTGDSAGVLRSDTSTEAVFSVIERRVGGAAEVKRQRSLVELAQLQHMVTLTRTLTPVVILAGLLVTVLALINRRHRRLLDTARAQVVHDSLHDALTGLPNRALLTDRLEQALRADDRAGTSTGLLLLDLDRLKEVNDTFGHHFGDELLARIGPRLAAGLRQVDTVARLGGDEFAILLPGVSSVNDASAVATKLVAALAAPFHVEGVDLDVEVSVGVVLSGEHGHDAPTLLRRADIARYVAKDQNLDVFVYNPAVDAHSPARLAMLGELRRALDRGELVLHYQPKISISTGEVVGAEALVRWQHPERGLVLPDAFIPVVERTGLIGPLTRHVLDTALAQARRWADAGRSLTIAVNLSARNLLDERLPDQVSGLLASHGVPPELLELEVTESAITTEPVRAQQLLVKLSGLGVRISIDDFGAGYTSLSQLKTLPVSELKIDRSFVMTMSEDLGGSLIVHSIIDLGHALGLTIVAEGVENEPTLTALAGLGCEIAQGYHLARPMTADAFGSWREQRRQGMLHPSAALPEKPPPPNCTL